MDVDWLPSECARAQRKIWGLEMHWVKGKISENDISFTLDSEMSPDYHNIRSDIPSNIDVIL